MPAPEMAAGDRGMIARAVTVAVLLTALSLPARAVADLAASEAPVITDAIPAAGGVVERGQVSIAADIVGLSDAAVTLTVDGEPVDSRSSRRDGRLEVTASTSLEPGLHVARLVAEHSDGHAQREWAFTVSPLSARRLAGSTRIGTAGAIAAALGDGPAPGAVLARADHFADALAGVGLAAAVGGPLLLTAADTLLPETRSSLEAHVAPGGTVYVLGGPAALAPQITDAVTALGFEVTRLAGSTRYETAVAIAAAQAELVDQPAGERVAVLASGATFADALAMAVPAAERGWPVLLTPPDALADAASAYLSSADVSAVEVVGGSAAISEAVTAALPDRITLRRTGGRDRYATASLIAERFFEQPTGAALASGTAFADGLAGGVLAARDARPLLLTPQRLPDDAAAVIAELADTPTTELVVFGGEAAVSSRAVDDALRVAADTDEIAVGMQPAAGTAIVTAPGTAPGALRLEAQGTPLSPDSAASVWLGDAEVATTNTVEDNALTVRIDSLPADLAPAHDYVIRVRAALVTTNGARNHVDEDLTLRIRPPLVTTREGFSAIGGAGQVVGRSGPRTTFSLEVEPATGVGPYAFADVAEAILSDPRGWTADGSRTLQRVEPAQADVRVLLAGPETVDRLCARAGLDTGGIYSCWNGEFAALNLDRWQHGADPFAAPLAVYRAYLVSHEVGHGLGYGHRGCPRAGALAPVMMQQTKGTGACVPNPWPYP